MQKMMMMIMPVMTNTDNSTAVMDPKVPPMMPPIRGAGEFSLGPSGGSTVVARVASVGTKNG